MRHPGSADLEITICDVKSEAPFTPVPERTGLGARPHLGGLIGGRASVPDTDPGREGIHQSLAETVKEAIPARAGVLGHP